MICCKVPFTINIHVRRSKCFLVNELLYIVVSDVKMYILWQKFAPNCCRNRHNLLVELLPRLITLSHNKKAHVVRSMKHAHTCSILCNRFFKLYRESTYMSRLFVVLHMSWFIGAWSTRTRVLSCVLNSSCGFTLSTDALYRESTYLSCCTCLLTYEYKCIY